MCEIKDSLSRSIQQQSMVKRVVRGIAEQFRDMGSKFEEVKEHDWPKQQHRASAATPLRRPQE